MPIAANVIVTCTKRKTVAVPEGLKLRCVRRAPIEKKSALWCKRLVASRADSIPARQLYSGDHWSIARSMESVTTSHGNSVRLWIASAGYGLISMDSLLKPYSATFSRDHPDSISQKTTNDNCASVYQLWWASMTQSNIVHSSGPRTIKEIVADSPNTPLLVIASENYLLALEKDLQASLLQLNDSDLLSVFSAGCKSLKRLTGHLVPYDARMQHAVGGALRSLNMRVALMALVSCRRSRPTYSVFRKKLAYLMRAQPELTKFDRRPIADAEVRQFILRELNKDSAARHTPLLRKLRDNGRACEQKRFTRLFREVQEQINVS